MTDSDATAVTDEAEEAEEASARADDLGHDRVHPRPQTYVAVAAILAVVTAGEIWLSYADQVTAAAATSGLLVLMAVKFVMVTLWFMHLRFDAPIFKKLFWGGLALAVAVYAIVLASSHVFLFGV